MSWRSEEMRRKGLQGLLARICFGRPKVADDNEEDDIVGRIAGRLTRASCTEERWAPDAGSATGELTHRPYVYMGPALCKA